MSRAALFALVLLPPFAAGQDIASLTNVQLPANEVVRDVVGRDVDGDGLLDLVIATSAGGSGRRALGIHRQRQAAPRFAGEADFRIELTPDVVAFAVADVHPDPGRELVLFSATGAFACRPRADERDRFVKLFGTEFLWQRPSTNRTVAWQAGVVDADGDGLDDLLVPEPDGYRVALQRRDGVLRFEQFVLRVPGVAAGGAGGAETAHFELRFGGFSAGEGGLPGPPLLAVDETIPAPMLRDWDGDGDLDVLAEQGDHLFCFVQDPRGRFAPEPLRMSVPVRAKRRRFDPSHRVLVRDLDGDGKVDGLALAGDRRSEDLRTQVLVFVQGKGGPGAERPAGDPLFGPDAVPNQLLVLAGFAAGARLDDVDGDGFRDLVIGSARLDLIDRLRASTTEAVGVELYVYRNRGGRFSRRPDLTYDLNLTGDLLAPGAAERVFARFFGDVSGDGLRELLVRDRPERLRLYLTRRRGDGLAVVSRPLWSTRLAAAARLRFLSRDPCPDIAILEPHQVVHVRFR